MMEQNKKENAELILRRKEFDRRLLDEMIFFVAALILASVLVWMLDLGIRFWLREAVWLFGLILNLLIALRGVLIRERWVIAVSLSICVCIILAQLYILL